MPVWARRKKPSYYPIDSFAIYLGNSLKIAIWRIQSEEQTLCFGNSICLDKYLNRLEYADWDYIEFNSHRGILKVQGRRMVHTLKL